MEKFFINLCLILISVSTGYYSYSYFNGKLAAIGLFISGASFGMFIMFLKLKSKNEKLNTYKRELEKESVSSDEAEARVKVLESKIKVLEKALENSLNK